MSTTNHVQTKHVTQSTFYHWTERCICRWHHKSLYRTIGCPKVSSWAVKNTFCTRFMVRYWQDFQILMGVEVPRTLHTHTVNGLIVGITGRSVSRCARALHFHCACFLHGLQHFSHSDSETAVMWYSEGCQPTCSNFHMNLELTLSSYNTKPIILLPPMAQQTPTFM